jgi:hypothetical protein
MRRLDQAEDINEPRPPRPIDVTDLTRSNPWLSGGYLPAVFCLLPKARLGGDADDQGAAVPRLGKGDGEVLRNDDRRRRPTDP